jgi:hypothetical protein
MSVQVVKKSLATVLVAALAGAAVPAMASPRAATLSGTVMTAATPLAGVLVVVKDAAGDRLASATTAADGSFALTDVAPGVRTLGVETAQGAFDVATPITLAPGETKGVHLAVRQEGDEEKKKKKGGAYGAGSKAGMIVTIVGFAVMAGLAIDSTSDDGNTQPASGSQPD